MPLFWRNLAQFWPRAERVKRLLCAGALQHRRSKARYKRWAVRAVAERSLIGQVFYNAGLKGTVCVIVTVITARWGRLESKIERLRSESGKSRMGSEKGRESGRRQSQKRQEDGPKEPHLAVRESLSSAAVFSER